MDDDEPFAILARRGLTREETGLLRYVLGFDRLVDGCEGVPVHPASVGVSLFRLLVADHHPCPPAVERCLQVGQAAQVTEIIALDPALTPALRDVVRGVTAPDLELGKHRDQVILVPIFVRVAEDEIEGPRQGRNDRMRIPEPGIDECRQSRRLEVREGLAVAPLIDVDFMLLSPASLSVSLWDG